MNKKMYVPVHHQLSLKRMVVEISKLGEGDLSFRNFCAEILKDYTTQGRYIHLVGTLFWANFQEQLITS